MDDRAFDEALDDLLSQPPEDFVEARNALVRTLKSEGRKEDAAALARWRRPTRTAWALNRLTQVDHDVVEQLVGAASAVRDDQAAGGAALRDAMSTLRLATRAATDAAVAAIAPARPSDHADVSAALLAVLSDSDALGLLDAGRLLEIPESGLGAFASGPAPSSSDRTGTTSAPKRPTSASTSTPEADATEEALRKARRNALDGARNAARQAKAALERAEAEVVECDRTMRLADERVTHARAGLADAEAEAQEAKTALESTTKAAAGAVEALADADRAVSDLEPTPHE